MIVNVEEQDIAQGQRFDPRSCPVALALNRAFRLSDRHVIVAAGTFSIAQDKDGSQIQPMNYLPEAVCLFIVDFDWGRPVEPFSFEVYQ